MESPAARLLHLLSLFSARPQWTATDLAERLGVTTRTVRRDVTQLRDLGYPIDSDAGRTGGYRLGAGGRLPPLLLTDDEAVAVAVGLRAATVRGVAGYDEAAVAAMAKLEQVLPAALRERVLALRDATVMVGETADVVVDPERLLTIAQGCRRHERIGFAYEDGQGRRTERRAEPYGLVNTERRWYAVAFCLDRRDWRTFRVDRMSGVELTGHTFEPRPQPDTEAMVLEGLSRFPFEHNAEVRLHADYELAARMIPHTVGTVEDAPDGPLLRIGANGLGWLARYLASLPVDVDVLTPPELRDELCRLGAQLAARHGSP